MEEMYQPVASLDMVRRQLKELGVTYVKDVGLESDVLKRCMFVPPTLTAYEIAQQEAKSRKVSTTIDELDELLYGGFGDGELAELCGHCGTGKTYLCLQICIRELLTDRNSTALYICTNDNFAPQRLKELIQSSDEYVKASVDEKPELLNSVMSRTQVLSTCNLCDLVATTKYLPRMLGKHKISVVVIDSIFIPVKSLNYSDRRHVIYRLLTDLQRLGYAHKFPIILTNNVTTRTSSGEAQAAPMYLGESYYHRLNTRIVLSKSPANIYSATVVKSSKCGDNSVTFNIS